MKVLVTGCAGFIGARVVEILIDGGDEVAGIDDLSGQNHRLPRLEGLRGFQSHRLDISEGCYYGGRLGQIFVNGRFDALIHLAAKTGVRASITNPLEYMKSNAGGTMNMLALCAKYGIRKFILASTSSLYGITDGTPSKETDPTNALSPYAASKLGAEAACEAAHHLHGIDVSILRYFTVYGPDGRPDMFVYRACEAAVNGTPLTIYGDGGQSRDYTYIDDIAQGTIAALEPVGCEVINLCAGNSVSLLDVIDSVADRPIKCRHEQQSPADVPTTLGDNDKAHRLLDWSPRVGINEGLAATLRYHRSTLGSP